MSENSDSDGPGLAYFREGDSVSLRKLRVSDLTERYVRWVNDPDVTRYMSTGNFPSTKEDVRSYVESKGNEADVILFAIVDSGEHVHVGNVKLGPIDWVNRHAELSILIGEKEFWGRGIGTEAIELLSEYAFQTLNLNKVYAGTYEDNVGMIRAFEKAGFTEEGTLKAHGYVDGEYVDVVRLGRTRS